ncbi:MAG TPA: hypothetical protein VEY30_08070 [Myxococcaceae bacterium]|nr:hypothetical protein [Myxococcaceae bacterium]
MLDALAARFWGPRRPGQEKRTAGPLFSPPRPATPPMAPPAEALVRDVRFGRLSSVEMNAAIVASYIRLGTQFQRIVDPEFDGRGGTSPHYANWFAVAAHSIPIVGQAMRAGAWGRHWLDERPRDSDLPGEMTARDPDPSWLDELTLRGVPLPIARVFWWAASKGTLSEYLDPRTPNLARLADLYRAAPGKGPREKAAALFKTLENTFADTNLAIFAEIGVAGEQYLEYRARHPDLTPAQIAQTFTILGSKPQDATRAFEFAVERAKKGASISEPGSAFSPPVDTRSLLVAGFALFELAGRTSESEVKNRLVKTANNYILYREQSVNVEDSFAPANPPPGEVNRRDLVEILTPAIRLDVGSASWSLDDYADRLPDRDGRWLTSKISSYDWSKLEDRWPAIQNAFETVYRSPQEVWRWPDPNRILKEDPPTAKPWVPSSAQVVKLRPTAATYDLG